MGFDAWLETTGGKHCLAVLAAFGVEPASSILELAFVAGQVDQAQKDRCLIRDRWARDGPAEASTG